MNIRNLRFPVGTTARQKKQIISKEINIRQGTINLIKEEIAYLRNMKKKFK